MKNKSKLFVGVTLLVFMTTSCALSPAATTPTPSVSAPSTTPTSVETSSTGTSSSIGPSSSTSSPISSSIAPISSPTIPVSSSTAPISSSTPTPSNIPENKTPLFTDFKQMNDYDHLTTTGDVNLLVVPVGFNDTTCNGGSGNCTTTIARIKEAFFGEGDAFGHESLSSYYKKSSYGKLNIQGEVTSVYQFPALKSFLAEGYSGGRYNQDRMYTALDNRLATAAKSFFGNGTTYNNVNYDNDGNGSVDGIWFVYLTDYNYTGSSSYSAAAEDILWAFTGWPSVEAVYGSYCWASYNFMDEGGYSYPDAHTLIHETGHLLGLDDYYDYDQKTSPTGGLDMMDNNILDHNPFSKYLMNWTTPTYINQSGTYKLDAFQENGDFFLLGNDWNGSQFDQYIVVEYYTPTGLNILDSASAYPGNNLRGFTENGVKIYVVDNRVGTVKYNTSWEGSWQGNYLDEFDESNFNYNNRVYIENVYSNTASYGLSNSNHPLIRLMESSGSNRFIQSNKYTASNASLFQQGDSFGASFSLYGEAFPFTLTIGACTDSDVTITVAAK